MYISESISEFKRKWLRRSAFVTSYIESLRQLLNLQKSTVAKLSRRWPNFWGNISRQTIHRALKNIGFTRKKKKTYGYKERSEEKRAQFVKIIATKNPDDLVYIDESGIDNSVCHRYKFSIIVIFPTLWLMPRFTLGLVAMESKWESHSSPSWQRI